VSSTIAPVNGTAPRSASAAVRLAVHAPTLPWRGRVDRRSEAEAVGVG